MLQFNRRDTGVVVCDGRVCTQVWSIWDGAKWSADARIQVSGTEPRQLFVDDINGNYDNGDDDYDEGRWVACTCCDCRVTDRDNLFRYVECA